VVDTEEPASFQEAQAHECWRRAMLVEMAAIEANGTWKLEEAPAGVRSISLNWVVKTKTRQTLMGQASVHHHGSHHAATGSSASVTP
jgi:hypothetical protein